MPSSWTVGSCRGARYRYVTDLARDLSLPRVRRRLLFVMLSVRNQLGRTAYLMEIDARYVDVIVKGRETLTGKRAIVEQLDG